MGMALRLQRHPPEQGRNMDNIPDISLALYAAAQEGRQPVVVSHSWWMRNAKPDVDYLVLQDDTWKAWVRQ